MGSMVVEDTFKGMLVLGKENSAANLWWDGSTPATRLTSGNTYDLEQAGTAYYVANPSGIDGLFHDPNTPPLMMNPNDIYAALPTAYSPGGGIAKMLWDLSTDAGSASGYSTAALPSIPTSATLEDSTRYGGGVTNGYSKDFLDDIKAYGHVLAGYGVDGAGLGALITSLMAPFVAQIAIQKQTEINKMTTRFSVANGFFNSAATDRLSEIGLKYDAMLAERLAAVNLQASQFFVSTSLSALQILSGYRNQPLAEKLEIERMRIALIAQITDTSISNSMKEGQIIAMGANFANDEAKRILYNDNKVWNRKLELRQWEADYLSRLANVPGTSQSPLSALAQGAMGIGDIAQGIIPALAGGGAAAGATGLATGTVAGLAGGADVGAGAAISALAPLALLA